MIKMFRVSKAIGWNKYRVQKRYLGFLWLNYGKATFVGYDIAALNVIRLNA